LISSADGWFDALRLWLMLFAASLTIVPLQRYWSSRLIGTRLYFLLYGVCVSVFERTLSETISLVLTRVLQL
jgi:hypothetical protein